MIAHRDVIMGWDEGRLGWRIYITWLAVSLLDVAKRLDPAGYVNDAVWGEL
jgi:hypothetical protein